MKLTRKNSTWFIFVLILVLVLSACVRPSPREESPTPEGNESATPAIVIPTTEFVQPIAPTEAYPAPTEGSIEEPAPGQPIPVETATDQPPAVEATPEQPVEPTPSADTGTNPQGERIHIVQAGENLFRIGLQYGFTYQELGAYNGIPAPYTIYVGQEIKIPPTP